MKIYTRTGDAGQTSLFNGSRVEKNDPRIEAYGTIDELNSILGVVRASWPSSPVDAQLHDVQTDLFDLGAYLASPGSAKFHGVAASRVSDLERAIDAMDADLPPLKQFILPGGSVAAAHLHVARTVCRRAERRVVALRESSSEMLTTIQYLNRLSDYLFVAARFANLRHGIEDVVWKRT